MNPFENRCFQCSIWQPVRAIQCPQLLDVSVHDRHFLDAMRVSNKYLRSANSAMPLPSKVDTLKYRAFLMTGLALLLVCLTGSRLNASDAPGVVHVDQVTIYFSFAPWDGAAYDIEIPLEKVDDTAQPNIRINIWGYPEFTEPKTICFSGREDAGGGPLKGDGCALFQAALNKSIPERLVGTVSFRTLKNDSPVSGNYELATLDGKRRFKGSFRAVWGNKPTKVIR